MCTRTESENILGDLKFSVTSFAQAVSIKKKTWLYNNVCLSAPPSVTDGMLQDRF